MIVGVSAMVAEEMTDSVAAAEVVETLVQENDSMLPAPDSLNSCVVVIPMPSEEELTKRMGDIEKDAKRIALEAKYGVYTPLREFEWTTVPLVSFGLIARASKKDFRAARNNFIPKYKNKVDDYLQYAPLVITTGLNLAGYKGRSNLLRYVSSAAASYGVMAILVNVIKYSAREMRPDGSAANSFPSGHTATVFAAATIMHKEYGLTRSPWWSVLAYTCATTTGIMRTLNNRHWLSDVLVGAGIGVVSTDIGYMLADLIFKKKGIKRNPRSGNVDLLENPSFFKLSLGAQFTNDIAYNGDNNVKVGVGTAVGAEAAYFINKYVGVGLRARVSAAPASVEGLASYDNANRLMMETKANDVLAVTDIGAGVYAAWPISSRHNVGMKLLYGRRFFGSMDFQPASPASRETGANAEVGTELVNGDRLYVHKTNGDDMALGLSYTYSMNSGMAISGFFDFDYSRPRFNVDYTPYGNDGNGQAELLNRQFSFRQKMTSFTLGASMTVMF